MLFQAPVFKQSHLLGLLLGLVSLPLFGQAPNSPIIFRNGSAITVTMVDAPLLSGRITSAYPNGNTQWLKVEFRYKVTPATGDFVDAAVFKIWIEGRDLMAPDAPDKSQGIAVGLTGAVTYVNIPKTREAYGVFYVHPLTLRRYSTKLGTTDFIRKFDIHLEADIDGKPVDAIDENKETDPNWYLQLRPIAGLVYKQYQTPFNNTDINRYPPIKMLEDQSGGTSTK